MNKEKELNALIKALIQDKKIELYNLMDIQSDMKNSTQQTVITEINKALTIAEQNFIKQKALGNYTKLRFDANDSAYDKKIDSCGNCDWFPAYLIRDEFGLLFHLPPLSGKKVKTQRAGDGKFISYVTKKLLSDYEATTGDTFQVVENGTLVFEHHINKNEPFKSAIDADNIDVKKFTDALFGYLIYDDNVVALRTYHYGVLDDMESYCDVRLMENASFFQWLKSQSDLFK